MKQTKTVRLQNGTGELVFTFVGDICSVRSEKSGRVQQFGDIAAQFLLEELKGYGWKEVT